MRIDALIRAAALLKRNALAAPFERAFDAQASGKPTDLMAIHYRDQEAIYIRALSDRVTVIFSTVFKEETDQIFGKVFLQEFVDARRNPQNQNAPQGLYTNKDPPLELRHLTDLKISDNVGYVTFGKFNIIIFLFFFLSFFFISFLDIYIILLIILLFFSFFFQ